MIRGTTIAVAFASLCWLGLAPASGQDLAAQPGYYDIPAGYDFPADKATLEGYRQAGNLSAERLHAWNVFAGMTQPTPDGKYAIFETWYAESEAFDAGPTPQAEAPRRFVPRFQVPAQMRGMPGQAAPQAAGSALLSFVMFNFANYKHIRTSQLYLTSVLQTLQQTGAADPHIPNNKTVPDFPADAVSLKTIWWPIKQNEITGLPIWDPATNPQIPGGNPFKLWTRVVGVDPTRTDIPGGETGTVDYHGQHLNSHIVSMKRDFHFVVVDAQTAANANANPTLSAFVQDVLGRSLQAGDYVVFLGTHLTTKEIGDWVWATFWWHDQPDVGPFAADRPALVKGVWRNYLMTVSYDLNLPREAAGKPHIAFNPWLEAGFTDGVVSNCMNCHHRAAFPGVPTNFSFLPIRRGDPDLQNDPSFGASELRTDFLWSIIFNAQ